jgi:hypothetical protein
MKFTFILIACAGLFLLSAACAERPKTTGEKVEDAMEKAGDKAGGAVGKAVDKTEDTARKVKEEIRK